LRSSLCKLDMPISRTFHESRCASPDAHPRR
jgi:hypothetical protein